MTGKIEDNVRSPLERKKAVHCHIARKTHLNLRSVGWRRIKRIGERAVALIANPYRLRRIRYVRSNLRSNACALVNKRRLALRHRYNRGRAERKGESQARSGGKAGAIPNLEFLHVSSPLVRPVEPIREPLDTYQYTRGTPPSQ